MHRRAHRLGVVTASIFLFALATPPIAKAAEIEPAQATVLPVDAEGGSPRTAKVLRESIEAGLERQAWIVDEPDSTAAGTGDRYTVRARVQARESLYHVWIDALDADGKVVGSVEAACEICGLAEAGALVADRSASLAAQLNADRIAAPILRISTTPTRAEVWLDGVLVGSSPLEQQVRTGKHTIELRAKGHVAQERVLSLSPGIERAVHVQLAREIDPASHRLGGAGQGLVIAGSISTSAAVALGIGGGLLLGIHGSEISRNCNADPFGNCARIHDTRTAGLVAVSAGVVALGAGVAMLTIGLRRRGSRRERFSSSGANLRVRF